MESPSCSYSDAGSLEWGSELGDMPIDDTFVTDSGSSDEELDFDDLTFDMEDQMEGSGSRTARLGVPEESKGTTKPPPSPLSLPSSSCFEEEHIHPYGIFYDLEGPLDTVRNGSSAAADGFERAIRPSPLPLLSLSMANPIASPNSVIEATEPATEPAVAVVLANPHTSPPGSVQIMVLLPAFSVTPSAAAAAAANNSSSGNSSSGSTGTACSLNPDAVQDALASAFGVNADGLTYFKLDQMGLDMLLNPSDRAAAEHQKHSTSGSGGSSLAEGHATLGLGSGTKGRSSSSHGRIGDSPTIAVALSGSNFSMATLEEIMNTCKRVTEEAQAIQQQWADKEEEMKRQIIRAELEGAMAQGDLGRLREAHWRLQEESGSDKRKLEELEAAWETLNAKLEQEKEKDRAVAKAMKTDRDGSSSSISCKQCLEGGGGPGWSDKYSCMQVSGEGGEGSSSSPSNSMWSKLAGAIKGSLCLCKTAS